MKDTMNAARMHRIGEFSVEKVPIPVPHGEELLVRIGACGVCGSDLPRIYVSGTSKQKYPLTLGHEFSGTVIAVGENADPALIGKRGAFFPLIPCRKCDSCVNGHYAMCEDYDYLGSRRDGGFAEYCLVPSAWHMVVSNSPETSFEELAMVEPACVAQHAILRRSNFYAGAQVLILGAGPIGASWRHGGQKLQEREIFCSWMLPTRRLPLPNSMALRQSTPERVNWSRPCVRPSAASLRTSPLRGRFWLSAGQRHRLCTCFRNGCYGRQSRRRHAHQQGTAQQDSP